MACRGPAERDGCVDVDAARVVAHDRLPDAIDAFDLDDRDAVRMLREANVLEALGRRLAEHVTVAAEFMIDREQAVSVAVRAMLMTPPAEAIVPPAVVFPPPAAGEPPAAVPFRILDREEPHAVVSDPDLKGLLEARGPRRGIAVVDGSARPDGLAPRDQHLIFIVGRDRRHGSVAFGDGNRREADQRLAVLAPGPERFVIVAARGGGARREEGRCGSRKAAHDNVAARTANAKHVGERPIVGMVADTVVMVHGCS
jgi:hypothetical protein